MKMRRKSTAMYRPVHRIVYVLGLYFVVYLLFYHFHFVLPTLFIFTAWLHLLSYYDQKKFQSIFRYFRDQQDIYGRYQPYSVRLTMITTLKTIVFVVLSIALFHVSAVLLGAPVLEYKMTPEVDMHEPVIGTIIGAWCGAFVIPLDWDRPWQEWPIPCSVGAVLGCSVGHLILAGLTMQKIV
ncbi:uncharacterized protein PIG-F isoform X2 [Centruroides vittatus]|uniref:uncharacterized protein PIG-F isoform X2 n=1 Tax=Centruroides vittatus TaxID=120091 RepID=UPI00350F13A1